MEATPSAYHYCFGLPRYTNKAFIHTPQITYAQLSACHVRRARRWRAAAGAPQCHHAQVWWPCLVLPSGSHVWCGCVSAICSLHPLKMIERPLTLSFNAIIPACHHLSTYPYVCLAVGRCSELLISFSQLISTPFNSLWCVYVAWRKIPPSLGLLFTLIPTFRGPWCSLSLCVSGQYTISHSSPWHGTHFPITPAKRDWKAWLHGKWPPPPSFTSIKTTFYPKT